MMHRAIIKSILSQQARGYFVTGTDTGVGKTWITVGLILALRGQGLTVAGMKPVATDCYQTPAGLRNEDAVKILAHTSQPFPYEWINVYSFEPAIAPHLAAREQGIEMTVEAILAAHKRVADRAELMVVEGVGGSRVPLNERQGVWDLARHLEYPVILVVGLRLGCINHAVLTAEAIRTDGLDLAGWVSNQIDPNYPRLEATLDTLRARLQAPMLAHVPWLDREDMQAVASYLSRGEEVQ
jgi:dethiobiotin synthetase